MNRSSRILACLSALLLLMGLVPVTVSAVTLARYEFTGADEVARRTVTSYDAGVAAGSFSSGTGLAVAHPDDGASVTAPDFSTGYARASTRNVIGRSAAAGDFAASYAADDYFSFVVTPGSGNALALESLTFDTSYFGTSAASNLSFAVSSSVGGFDNVLATFNYAAMTSGYAATAREVNLDLPAYENLTGDIEFRFYIYDNNSSSRTAAIDNVTLNGIVVAVPEPSMALLFAGGLGMMALRRRRRCVQV